ncbi:MAG: DHH family phosphoesterase [Candidatus Woesearchaeota archaeon]|nr:DHH family phosphoesterase [Candidatus Woesearchaeota archaeon]
MDNYIRFKQSVKYAAERFRRFGKNSYVRLVSHIDADGISAVSIMIRALDRENIRYSVSIVQNLTADILKAMINEEKENNGCCYDMYIFTDLGSGILSDIIKILSGKKVVILDHHEIDPLFDADSYSKYLENKEKRDNEEKDYESLIFINPLLFGIEGSKEISASGVAYLFAQEIDEKNKDMSHIAVIGAIGDVQEKKGFSRLNVEILQAAIESGLIKAEKNLRVFGSQTRPIHKILEYSTDPYIPGVTGSESRAIEFLLQLGINPKKGNEWKKLNDLTEEEMKRLIAGVIMKRKEENDPDDVIGHHYILTNEKEGSPLRDAKEFATLLNAFGRLGKASIGISICLGDEKAKQKALQQQAEYKKEILTALNWYKEKISEIEREKIGGKKTEKREYENSHIIKGDNYIIINAKENIMHTIIGTLASMITKSNELKEGTFVVGMARDLSNNTKMTKVSLRVAGKSNVDLAEIMSNAVQKVGGEYGGHANAAGGLIKTEYECAFIESVIKIFEEKIRITEE